MEIKLSKDEVFSALFLFIQDYKKIKLSKTAKLSIETKMKNGEVIGATYYE
jgi:hypothetical protein